jgi:hypothetical protein
LAWKPDAYDSDVRPIGFSEDVEETGSDLLIVDADHRVIADRSRDPPRLEGKHRISGSRHTKANASEELTADAAGFKMDPLRNTHRGRHCGRHRGVE